MRTRKPREGILETVIARYGGMAALAERFGISVQAVAQWSEVPSDRCVDVHRDTGIPLPELRPDLYPVDLVRTDGKPRPKPETAEVAA